MSEQEQEASHLPIEEPGRVSPSGSAPQIALPCSDNIAVPLIQPARQDLGQATLSTISEVTVAADEALSRSDGGKSPTGKGKALSPQTVRWLTVADFFLIVYVVSCGLAIYALTSAPWTRVFLAPLFPVVAATLTFAWRGRWKARARDWESELGTLRQAAGSLGHEAANGVNAIRANLLAFRLANSQAAGPEYLEEIEAACRRIEAAVEKSRRCPQLKTP